MGPVRPRRVSIELTPAPDSPIPEPRVDQEDADRYSEQCPGRIDELSQGLVRPKAVLSKAALLSKGNSFERSETTTLNESPDKDLEVAKIAAPTSGEDPNIVDWDGDNDPANPMNWSNWLKWSNILGVSALTLLTPLASSILAPGVSLVAKEFDVKNETILALVVSIYVLGYAFGPIFIAPASELLGRLYVYHVCNIIFIAFTVACAKAPSMTTLIVFRFFQGVWGSCPVTIGGGTIADLMEPDKRGGAMAIWAMGPLMGPIIGPVGGGFLAQAKGWRWIFWLVAIATGGIYAIAAIFLRETYAPVILARKAARLRKQTGNNFLRSKLDEGETFRQLFHRAIWRPMKLLCLSPICSLMSFYMALVYAYMYLMFTTFTFVFEGKYGFSPSIVGLSYIGLGIGLLLGLAVLGATSDRIMTALAKKYNNGVPKPEYRLPALIWMGPFIPIGLFLYGWTTQYKVQWAVPMLGTLFIGVGLIAVFMGINTYLVDTFTLYAASAMAANTILRSLFGGLLPLGGLQMYQKLGLGWGNSLLAFLALACCPIPWMFYKYGEKIRTHPRFQVKL